MTERIFKHYDPPVPFEKYVPAVSRTEKPKPNAKRAVTMTDYDTSRGPYHAMLDRMARARQAITGETYAKAFTETYCDPKNSAIRDGSKYDDLAKAFDATYGTAHSLVKAAKAAPYDPLAKAAELAEIRGPAHAKLHSMAVDHQRAHPGQSYQSAYGYLYAKPENVSLREKIKSEHMRATMSAHAEGEVGKAAPPDPEQDPEQDYVSPSARTPAAADELDRLVVTRMKNNPGLSREQAFVREYLSPANRSLKERYDAEGILRAQAREPAPPFPAYSRG
jgi:hypothetical protein